ncbi:BON domain-containing protein [Leptolyngbya sp. PCC 6406]|uniref:BON domain-containing protein n=1 Tax=Leptolyngbya sp. PCC 6406 TaxID=1173264 RepID=UPI0002AC744F|nr:BON domain-containing protein [Leptolyngbya sp. PCC 6406]
MKKIIPLMLGSLLLLGATACSEEANTSGTEDGVRSEQRESDQRAREQRDGMGLTSDNEQKMLGDVAVEARNTLETNLPGSRLAVNIEDGIATVEGTVTTQEQFDEIEPLAMGVEGIESVNVEVEVKPN